MKKLTRVLSVVMAIAMLFTMSMSASAATYTDVKAEDSYYEAVEALSALGVVKGYEEGDFQPEGKITRAEAAAIIMRIMGMAAVENTRMNTQFTDVTSEHWASGVIAAAADSAIVNGMGDGTFAPSAEVTYDQVVKMLVCAMGYQKKAEASVAPGTNVFPTGYNIVANQKRITEGTAKTEGGATRGTVARLVYNALTVNLMDQTSFGTDVEFKEVEKASILYTKLNAVEVEAKIKALKFSSEENTVDLSVSKIDKVAEKNDWTKSNFSTIKKGDVDLTGLQGLTVKALVDVSDSADPVLLAVFPQAGKNAELVISPELFVEITSAGKIKYYKDADATVENVSSQIEAGFTAYINMTPIELTDASDVAKIATDINGIIGTAANLKIAETNHKAYRFVDTDNDGKYDTLFIDNSASFVVGKVNATNYQISKATEGVYNSDKKFGYSKLSDNASAYTFKPLDLNTEDGDVAYDIKDAEGNALTFEDIKVGDILTVAWSFDGATNYYDITVSSASAVEGTITEVTKEAVKYNTKQEITYYVIDGKAYRVNGVDKADELEAGSAGTFNITADGTIISFDAVATSKTYGVVVAAGAKTGTFSNGVQVQIVTQDGTIETFDFADKTSVFTKDGEKVIESTVDAKPDKEGEAETKGFQAAKELTTDIEPGTVVIYETNSDDEIRRIYVDADAIKAKDKATLSVIDEDGDKKDAYKALTGKLDGKILTEETVIIAIPGTSYKANKDKYSIISLDALADEVEYEGYLVYNSEKEVKFAFITNLAIKPAMNTVPMVITGISETSVNNETRKKYTGLVDGQEVSYVMAEEVSYVPMSNGEVESKTDDAKLTFAIEKNDVIQVVLNTNEEIISYRHLLNWDATTKKYYAMIADTFKEDAKNGVAAKYVALDDTANALSSIVTMDGAAVAAIADKVGNNYVSFETKLSKDIIYDDDNVTAYIFGATAEKAYAKAKVTTVDQAELLDDYENDADVDDIVYLYSYDGDNVFAFIWDVKADNK